jgi:hypothetical protein
LTIISEPATKRELYSLLAAPIKMLNKNKNSNKTALLVVLFIFSLRQSGVGQKIFVTNNSDK